MNKILPILAAAFVVGAALLYFLIAVQGQTGLTPGQWALFGGIVLVLGAGVFLPIVLRRGQTGAEHSVSRADLRFAIIVAAVLCPLAFAAVWMFGPMGSMVITLAPLAFIIRSPRRRSVPARSES